MKIQEAYDKFMSFNPIDTPFEKLFSQQNQVIDIINKGKVGQVLELLLGMKLGNSLNDFEDGELKTNKADKDGLPKETMFITQISSQVDNLLTLQPFENSNLLKKINRILYIPVAKTTKTPKDWYFKTPIIIELSKDRFLYEQLQSDYYAIINKMKADIEKEGRIHTSSGQFIQIRTKDSKPYTPIKSNTYGQISDKNYAFYFKKDFMLYILKNSEAYPHIN